MVKLGDGIAKTRFTCVELRTQLGNRHSFRVPRLPALERRREFLPLILVNTFPAGYPGQKVKGFGVRGNSSVHSLVVPTRVLGLDRVPQSGWLYEPRAGQADPGDRHGPFRHTYRRTHRWARVQRDQDELAIESREERVAHVLFSASPDDLGLYGKPMARNAQLWTDDYHALLNGPWATPSDIHRAMHAVAEGGLFGYRFQYPAMRVGAHEVYWHRPLVAYLCPQTGEPTVLRSGPLGYLTAYPADAPDPAQPIVLWPRLLDRPYHVEAVSLFEHVHDPCPYQTSRNVRRLLEARDFFGAGAIPRDFARQMMNLPRQQSLDDWLATLEQRASPSELGRRLAEEMQTWLADSSVEAGPAKKRRPPPSLTFERTARRSFEVSYWKTIAHLAEGKYVNKDNADCVRDATTQSLLKHHCRDLEALGDYLLAYYRRQVQAARMTGKALVGELPFRWTTDFNFDWSGGWLQNQEGSTHERDIVLVIPGRDRRRAVIMADHYDTAYMEDHYDGRLPKKGARLAASGADDNHSATAALMLGAPIFMELSRAGKLACDVWLVHLTGEEFPADCLGARHLCERLVEGALKLRLTNGEDQDLSRVRVQGVYVLDMVAHNNDRAPDIFQIAPGTGCAVDLASVPGAPCGRVVECVGGCLESTPVAKPAGPWPPKSEQQENSGAGKTPSAFRRGPAPLRSPEHALQHRWPDFLGRRRSGSVIHGELRYHPERLPR